MITFHPGTARYDLLADVYRFDAIDDAGPLACALSREGLEGIAERGIDESQALDAFDEHQGAIFRFATHKYERHGRDDRGALSLSTLDVVQMIHA